MISSSPTLTLKIPTDSPEKRIFTPIPTPTADKKAKPKLTRFEQWCFFIATRPRDQLTVKHRQAFAQIMAGKNSDEKTQAELLNHTYHVNLLYAHEAFLISLKNLNISSLSPVKENKADDEKNLPAEKKMTQIKLIMRYIKHKVIVFSSENPSSKAKIDEIASELTKTGKLSADDLFRRLQTSFGVGEFTKGNKLECEGLSEATIHHYTTTYLKMRMEIIRQSIDILKRTTSLAEFDQACKRLIDETNKQCGDTFEEQKQIMVNQRDIEPDVSALVQLPTIPVTRLDRSTSLSSTDENSSDDDDAEASDDGKQEPTEFKREDAINELNKRANPNAELNGKKLIYYIIKNNHHELLPILINWKVKINEPCVIASKKFFGEHIFPLEIAASKGHDRLVRELVQARAKILPSLLRIKDNKENTIFHMVANGICDHEKYHDAILRLLKGMPREETFPEKKSQAFTPVDVIDGTTSPLIPSSPLMRTMSLNSFVPGKSKEAFQLEQIKKYWLSPNSDNQSAFYILCKRWLENKKKYHQARQHLERAITLLDAEIRLINTKIPAASINDKIILQAKREELLQAKLKLIEGTPPTTVFDCLKSSSTIAYRRRWWTHTSETLARIRKINIDQPINNEPKYKDPFAPDAQLNKLNQLIHSISQENLGAIGTIITDIESGKDDGNYFPPLGSHQPNPIFLAADLSAKAASMTKNLVKQARVAEKTLGIVRAYLHVKIYGHCDNTTKIIEGVDPELLVKKKAVDKLHNRLLFGKISDPTKVKRKLLELEAILNVPRHPWLSFWKKGTTSGNLLKQAIDENFDGIKAYSAHAHTQPQQQIQQRKRKSRIGYT